MTRLSQAQAGPGRQVGTVPRAVRGPVGRDSTRLSEKMQPGVELMRPGRDRPTEPVLGAHKAGMRRQHALGAGAQQPAARGAARPC